MINGCSGRAYGVVMVVAHAEHTGVGGGAPGIIIKSGGGAPGIIIKFGGGAPGIIIRSGGGPSGNTVRLMAEVPDGNGPRKYNKVWR